ncbi:periplasmic chaperone for outer membrane proteins Skp [Gelidibacter sediminis]|uniref:Periplasmic chaperone for outer membrane proteins Skp n=1 Tax=Gelidibacter sediminis TaxID=1608710 RepID=A0A4R7Q9U5_9FLAO|nr:OmpH family outer membrane protein [Gelidibacter sediminis]TDU43530.1 periplasmic chaperone for outer membrane proteins Skp [Gelidibacter sediminis]
MKKGFIALLTLVMLSSCQEQTKIGFVDNSKLINEYQKKKDIEAKFQVEIDAFNKKVDSIGQSFQAQAAEMQAADPKMVQKSSQEKYQALAQQYQRFQQQFQMEEQQIQSKSQAQIDTLIKDVRAFVKNYGEKNGYSYILGSNEAGSVMYGEESKDLTKDILEALNAEVKKD